MSVNRNPIIWGPPLWSVLHYITFHYCPSDSREIKYLFTIHIPNLLPCKPCRNHYLGHIKKHPIQLESAEALSRWLVKIHNLINKQTGKTKHFTYAQAKQRYTSPYAKVRVRNDFIKWNQLIRSFVTQGPLYVQKSYGLFTKFCFTTC